MTDETTFNNYDQLENLLENTSTTYKFDQDAPVSIRRIRPNSTDDTQVYSKVNEDPRTIHGLGDYSTTADIDEEVRQTEVKATETMARTMQLAIVGDKQLPEKYAGKIIAIVGLFQFDGNEYGQLNLPDKALVLSAVIQKNFPEWREDLNTEELLQNTPTEYSPSTNERKDIDFVRELGDKKDPDNELLRKAMISGVKQCMELVVKMEKQVSDAAQLVKSEKILPRKIIFVASIRQDNIASQRFAEDIGFVNTQKTEQEEGIVSDLYLLESA